jgi:arylsulfatase A-like enzyme
MPGEAAPPNIIFILADDLGHGDLGCYGQTNFATPNIDRRAAGGMRFTQHYAGSTVCLPSRACLMTGLHTGHVYLRGNGNHQFRPDPEDPTVARILKNGGYHTALIGKSGLSGRSQEGALANRKGFDHFFGYVSHNAAHRYFPETLWRNGELETYPKNRGKEGETYSGKLFLKDALQYLELQKAGPFFLHLSLQQPHADLAAPPEWREKFLGRYEESLQGHGNYRKESHPKATFAAMVAYLDDTVGQIVAKLEELGIAENTIVLFSSDNGPMSEGGWDRGNFNSGGILRGGKRDLYEGGVRVPLIAYWPGKIKAGSVSDHVSAHWDFLPTACDVAGVESPAGIDGISYLPALRQDANQRQHDYLYWEFYERGGKQAVRWGKWKGVRLNVGADRKGPIELYNLDTDPRETTNIASSHPNVLARLAEFMDKAHVESPIFEFK